MTKIALITDSVRADPKAARYIQWVRTADDCTVVFLLSGSTFTGAELRSLKWSDAIALIPLLTGWSFNGERGSLSLNPETNAWE